MAIITASAQLRSAGRQGSAIADDLIAFGEDETWQKSVLDYALDYSRQVKLDYGHFFDDWKKGFYDGRPGPGKK